MKYQKENDKNHENHPEDFKSGEFYVREVHRRLTSKSGGGTDTESSFERKKETAT